MADRTEKRHPIRRVLQSVLFTPYDWKYTLQLPRYLARPGRSNRSGIERPPLAQEIHAEKKADTTIVAGGDIIQTRGNEPPRFDPALQDVLGRADMFVANCEAPVLAEDNAGERIITFGMPVSFLEDILDQVPVPNEDCLLSVASNHSRDQEEHTFRDGVQTIEDDLGAVPIGLHDMGGKPYTVVDGHGPRMGVVAWTHLMNGERVLPPRQVVNRDGIVRQIDWEQVKAAEDLDMLVGMPHWDRSYQHFPHRETRDFAAELIQNGFDLLLGSHPHVVQPLEVRDRALCMYSRGNLASKHYLRYETRLRPIVEIDIAADGDLVGYEVHHFAQHRDDDGLAILPLEKLPDSERERYEDLIGTVFDTTKSVKEGSVGTGI